MENLLNDTNILIGIYAFASVLFGFGIATWIYEIQLHKTVKSCCKSIDGAVDKTAEFYEGKISELKAQIKELEKKTTKLDLVGFGEWLRKRKTRYGNYLAKETVRKYMAKLETGYNKEQRDKIETVAYNLYQKYLKERKK